MRLFVFFITLTNLIHSQATKLGEFEQIKVFDGLRVTVILSNSDSLVVEGKNKDYLSIKNKNRKLYLRMNLKKRLGGFNTTVALFCSSPLEVIDVNQGSFISFQDVLFQPSIILKADEGSEIEATLDVQKVITRTASGGLINIKGSSVIQDHSVIAGGTLNAGNLDSEQVVVRVKAGGKAVVRSTELAEAKVSFGGSVVVYGEPKKLIKSVAVGGSIELKEDPKEKEESE
jgi:hypothetical protein